MTMAVTLPSVEAGIMRDMIRPLSTPNASAYMPESGTTPAPMPPPIIGMATYMIASTKP